MDVTQQLEKKFNYPTANRATHNQKRMSREDKNWDHSLYFRSPSVFALLFAISASRLAFSSRFFFRSCRSRPKTTNVTKIFKRSKICMICNHFPLWFLFFSTPWNLQELRMLPPRWIHINTVSYSKGFYMIEKNLTISSHSRIAFNISSRRSRTRISARKRMLDIVLTSAPNSISAVIKPKSVSCILQSIRFVER